ncbi:MAG TPA: CRISPR-associated protein Cas4 [Ktedonobacteraceae bacterium]|nr:CRISPR-associated protein Cas4 [Ktedonobacteraceae bacterium]
MISSILLPIGLGLLLLAFALLILILNERRAQRRRLIEERHRALGLPAGELVYEDADGQGEPLYSSEYPLVGKPDYVVQLPDGRPVPIELKPSVQNATTPYSNHVVQIAAYCLILEDYFELPPTHGLLRYADREFTVDYTPTLRKKVIRLLTEMERCSQQQPPPLTRQRASKCRVCTFQPICPVGRGK